MAKWEYDAIQAWCKERMIRLNGSDDLTLVRWLMACSSGGEVAEYIATYLGNKPEVVVFTAEFLRRKHAEQTGIKQPKHEPRANAKAKAPPVPAKGAPLPVKAKHLYVWELGPFACSPALHRGNTWLRAALRSRMPRAIHACLLIL